jgi:phenylacetate-coenzyme A ligase PaaK-like adenylate-forming protein
MSSTHPERERDNGLEPTVGEQLRLAQFVNALDKANEDELRQIAKQMAQQVLVTYPSALRFLAREAARNLAGEPWSQESSEKLMAALAAPHDGAQ